MCVFIHLQFVKVYLFSKCQYKKGDHYYILSEEFCHNVILKIPQADYTYFFQPVCKCGLRM